MKSAFLVLYLWHAASFTITSGGGANGGPVLQIVPMSSLAACEVVGKAAKALADTTRPNQGEGAMQSQSASYRCVEVSR